MKKIIFRLLLVLVVLLIAAAIGVHLFLDRVVKRGVETYGPVLTQVDVKLDSVHISLLSGSGKVKGLFVGNPTGFKSPSAIIVGSTHVVVEPKSLLEEKVVVRTINIEAPEITFETGLNVKENNLSKILANIQESTGGTETAPAQPKPEAKAGKKLQVDEFVITQPKLRVLVTALGDNSATTPLPDIRLKDLGQGPEGITAAELTKLALRELIKEAEKTAQTVVSDMSKGAVYMSKELGTNAVDKATKGLGDLWKTKKK